MKAIDRSHIAKMLVDRTADIHVENNVSLKRGGEGGERKLILAT
jgi:hypothetical protein